MEEHTTEKKPAPAPDDAADSRTIYLIDGSAFIHRAYHAIRGLSNSKGLPTNAVFGFTRMLVKLIQERAPAYTVMCFDARGPTFRHHIYKDYKANRPSMPEDLVQQLPYIRAVVKGFQIPVIEMPGYEADDLIGTLARSAREADFTVVMVTGDKDFMQLVNDASVIWDPMKDKRIDLTTVATEYGVEPRQLVDAFALSGDTSDNIPGVPGIGPKRAVELIRRFGSLESLYDQIDQVTQKKLKEALLAHREQAFLSRSLTAIDTTVPVPFDPDRFRFIGPDPKKLSVLFKELEFKQLLETFSTPEDKSGKDYRLVTDEKNLNTLVARLEKTRRFALDTETTALNPMRAELVGISVAMKDHEGFYIPIGHLAGTETAQLPQEVVFKALAPIFRDSGIEKVGQNIKYDWIVLTRSGLDLSGVAFDTMVASYLIDPSKRSHGLDQIAMDFLDYRKTPYHEVAGKGKESVCFSEVPLEKAADYACEDADITLMAHRVLSQKLKEADLIRLFDTVEMPLVPVLKDMEMHGVRVDQNRLRQLSESFQHQLETLEEDIYSMAGQRFNIQSSQQLGEILFDKLGLPTQKKTRKKTGYSTDVGVLTFLAAQHELPAYVLRHRTLSKLKSTYADALLELIHPETGRIHTSYNQTVTATGRLSSSDPNLQNIPIRTEEGRQIRSAFIPRNGWQFLSADYSQIELRILAHCSEDPILIEAFLNEEDIHTRTATEVFEIFPEMVTPELRRQAKVINFGILYGMGAYRLSQELGISQKMAQAYINHYFSRYKGVQQYIYRTLEKARTQKKVHTLLGRTRPLPDMDSRNAATRQFAERTAVNTPIQGSAADLIKVAMIRIHQTLKQKKLNSAMILTVHDELVFEVDPEEKKVVSGLIQEIMEGIWELRVPLKVNLAWGDNWAKAH
ncbi:MAG: DNA polymerase I [Deltaproteobacteria bacterium]|nr:DNA polymerase I [Deltaproteobacteria bacterium]